MDLIMNNGTFVCQAPQSPAALTVSLLDKYLPSPAASILIPLPPPLRNALSTAYLGALILGAMFLAAWIIDHFEFKGQACLERKMAEAFPDARRRRAWLVGMVREMDGRTEAEEGVVLTRALLREMVRDAALSDEEWENCVSDGDCEDD